MTLAIAATLDKAYGACVALRGATIALRPGTVHALVGENGAGKSNLVRIVAGVVRGDRGELVVDGVRRELAGWDRTAARAAGIGIVQQHGASAGTLTVVENAVLGSEGGVVLHLAATARALRTLGDKVGLPIEPAAAAGELPLGAGQRAEIVAALHHGARVLILDEPTAVLTPVEVDGLLARLRALAAAGTTILLVTHKLDEVCAVADDVTVLRAGATVATFSTVDAPLEPAAIARAMVGAELPPATPAPSPPADAPVVLAVTAAALGALGGTGGIDLVVRAGEIVGVAGVDGNGQRELAHAIAGLAPLARGRITLAGVDVTRASPGARLATGLAHIPEDRQHGGLLLDSSIEDNLALGRRDITGRWRIDRARVRAHAAAQIAALDIRPPVAGTAVRALSGGNQQKVVVGRELSRPGLRLVLAVQPTRGVDLGAVARIHGQLCDAARTAGVLVISADLDELLAVCHRVVVLLRGQIVGERAGAQLHTADARAALGALMTGVTAGADAPAAPAADAGGRP